MTTSVPEPGRRERRKAENRRRLMDAALALIGEGGPDAIRISDVTDRADVGFGTFYSYFDSKEALIEAVISEVMRRTAETIGTRAAEIDDPAEAAAVSYASFIAFATDEPQIAAALAGLPNAEQTFEAALAAQARRALERGAQTGRFDIEDLELALTSVAASALAAIRAALAGRLGPEPGRAGATMLLRSLGVPDAEAKEIAGRPLQPIPAPTAARARSRGATR